MNFLSARWENLLMANYIVNPECLQPYCPKGTRIDQLDGRIFVSLVAFWFEDARIMGLPIPGHQRFEEVNLRFYVTPNYDSKIRGVTFIQEVVPRTSIAIVANALFNERYVKRPMSHKFGNLSFSYSWGANLQNQFSAKVSKDSSLPSKNSVEEFITEHYFGYSCARHGALEYRVRHPQWECRQVEAFDLSVKFGEDYGPDFAFLDDQSPFNVLFAAGSQVTASFPRLLKSK
ncbi:MAG: DUF2071 domain-containing protein [Planctomycetales bacterium]|nr:DUF2071 domain-containing protein [Planctomycetales bacterium]